MLLQEQLIRESVNVPAVGSAEALRQILTTQQQAVSYDEASEIADTLVEFYEALAEEADDESAS